MIENKDIPQISRRDFLKNASAAMAGLALPVSSSVLSLPPDEDSEAGATPIRRPLPAPMGRIATWWRQAVRSEPSSNAPQVAWKSRDEIISLKDAVEGEAPWPGNPIWYHTEEGYIHSGYVQLVDCSPSTEIVTSVSECGFWAQVCVPIAEARWQPSSARVRYKLYYGTVYRVVDAAQDSEGEWWYQLQEGITYSPGPYVPAWSMCRISSDQLAPISPGHPDKWIRISRQDQRLTCFEGEKAVFTTPISSGAPGTVTPRGEHRIHLKRHTSRMIGGTGDNYYDLPGVAFPVYFTASACAVHGCYWHNDFVRPHSHGCVNVTGKAAQWVFRWTDPVIPYGTFQQPAGRGEGTAIIVV
jgi:hypothetical protein